MLKHNFLLTSGMVASVLFIIISEIDGNTRQGYKAYYYTISHLSLGDRAWLGISSAITVGILLLIFSYSLRKEICDNRSSIIFYLLGIGMILSSVFVMDPILGYPPETSTTFTLRGRLHDLFTIQIISSLIIICFYWGRVFNKKNIKKWSRYSYMSGYIIILSSVIYVAFIFLELWNITNGLPIGLFERIAFYTGFIWIFLFSYYIYRNRDTRILLK